jgi:hypothetical protein
MKVSWLLLPLIVLWLGLGQTHAEIAPRTGPRSAAPESVNEPVGVRQNNSPPGAASALAPATTQRTRAPVSPLIYPRYDARLPAAHQAHAEKTKLTCDACHSKAKISQAAGDWLGPGVESCRQCHEARFDAVPISAPTSARIRFSHAKHAARNIECIKCHDEVALRQDARGNERLPSMTTCLRCHNKDHGAAAQGGNCRLCHVPAGSVIKTRFREGMLVPTSFLSMRHDAGWLWQHGDAAMVRGPVCAACHQESECVNCHNGRLRPRQIHPSDWLSLHGIEARQAGSGCGSCHRSQSECLTCHLRAGLSPSGPGAARAGQGRFHLPASIWTDRPRTARHHAVQARLHLDECTSCHQERDCALCHATAGVGGPGQSTTGGFQVSPHPPGFRNRCGGLLARNPRPCLVCHQPGDPNMMPCQ